MKDVRWNIWRKKQVPSTSSGSEELDKVVGGHVKKGIQINAFEAIKTPIRPPNTKPRPFQPPNIDLEKGKCIGGRGFTDRRWG